MFNLDWFDTWIYHIVGWPILVLVLCAAVWMRVNWKTALIILPLSFIALGLLIVDIEKIFGRAYPALPEGKWSYLYHKENAKSIELLVLDKQGTRLYTIVLNEENREQLEKMGKTQKNTGVQQEGEFVKQREGSSTDKTQLEFYAFPHQQHIKK